jgi:hypothetical protein
MLSLVSDCILTCQRAFADPSLHAGIGLCVMTTTGCISMDLVLSRLFGCLKLFPLESCFKWGGLLCAHFIEVGQTGGMPCSAVSIPPCQAVRGISLSCVTFMECYITSFHREQKRIRLY